MDSYDVVQVGYGPVGQVMAALLGQEGHRVGVFERHPTLYGNSRAGHIDDEVMRIFQSIGAADEMVPHAWPLMEYGCLDVNREPLQMFDWSAPGPSGWQGHYLFYQPDLEDALDRAARRHPSVEIHQNTAVVGVEERDDDVVVTVRDGATGESRSVRARYVIGADGANSLVREVAGIDREDFGFSEEWLVIDLRPHDPDVDWDFLPSAQICDPKQPVTAIRRQGHKLCRFEFMVMPGQTAEEMERPEKCWSLMEPFGPTPENSELTRHTVYKFESLLAQRFHEGRLLLVGDAAHLMPPFMGQGMCSGIRDAVTLGWRLDLVLRGVASPDLFDSYTSERRPHVEALTRASIALGEVVCTIDEEKAAARDAAFRAGEVPPPPPFPGITAGVLAGGEGRHPAVGELSRQGRIELDGREGRFDDLVGAGWRLLLAPGVEAPELDPSLRRHADEIGLRVLRLAWERGQAPADRAVDLEGRYREWFDELGAVAALVRPDFYVFGVAETPDEIQPLVEELRNQLFAVERQRA